MKSPLSPDVHRVARLLRGRSIVVIGGGGRAGAVRALKQAFGLKHVNWITTKKHDSYTSFEPAIARPDVAAVLLLIRWASHSFGNVAAFCSRYGKPLVRLPNGYNPNQVAKHVLGQAGDRLGSVERGSGRESA